MDSQRSVATDIYQIPQMWYRPSEGHTVSNATTVYRPAALVECRMSFRSIRAGFQYSDERYYTAWYPTKQVTIDWSSAAVGVKNSDELGGIASADAGYQSGDYNFSSAYFDDLQEELIEYLVRTAKYSVLYNANFSLYSEPKESRETFLSRCGDLGVEKIEPDLKRLLGRFELAIEQLREAQARRGRKLEGDKAEEMFSYWRDLFAASEKGLADMFIGKFRMVLQNPIPRPAAPTDEIDQDLMDELQRVERDAKAALNTLYTDYIQMVEQCDAFDVGLQRENIHVIRRALLWVPSESK